MQDQKPDTQSTNKEPRDIKPGPPPVSSEEPKLSSAETKVDLDDDAEIIEAVDDIAAKEADAVLKAEDNELSKTFVGTPKTIKEKIKALLVKWWENPKARWSTIAGVLALLLIVGLIPTTRYAVLNTVGIRASASIKVMDDSTKLPLKNVKVTIKGKSAATNSEGVARLTKLKLGKAEVNIEKRAFAQQKKTVSLHWGSNSLSEASLQPVGVQYALAVSDYLSDEGVAKAEASYGDANAVSDEEGKILLTIDNSDLNDDQKFTVLITADEYRDEEIEIVAGTKELAQAKLVPARKEVFVSKRSGKFELYKIDIDGKNEQLVLTGTGHERNDMTLVSHPREEIIAFVSTRDNIRNTDGYLLSSLDIINIKDNIKFTIAQSEKIQIIGWQGDNLVFVQVAAGASASDPRRQRLVSYDSKTAGRQELASSNYFNDITMAKGQVYYSSSSAFQNDQNAKLYKVNPDGTNRQAVLEKEVFNMFRSDYDTFYLSAEDWYEYKAGTTATKKLSGEPASLANRVYIDSNDKKHSLWSDQRDGKGVLLSLDTATKSDRRLHAQSGLTAPYRWLTDKIAIFRVATPQETADYAINIENGPPRKIKDVTNTLGIGQWYYY